MTFNAAYGHPLLNDWLTVYYGTQVYTWASEWRLLAARGLDLYCNDPFVKALVEAHLQSVSGPSGLRLASLYDPNPGAAETDEPTRQARRKINAICTASWYGRDLDAGGLLTRKQMEDALALNACVLGEGFATRVVKPGRNGRSRSRWRLVDPTRVRNPTGILNHENLRDGFQLANGEITGIWVDTGFVNVVGQFEPKAPVFVPWNAPDGTPNVIHRTGLRLPGMIRGVTRLAPMIIMQRQVGATLEAHVAAKRMQAVQAMIVRAKDPAAWLAAQANGCAIDGVTPVKIRGALNVLVLPEDAENPVEFLKTEFTGADLKDYLTICYRVQCATMQMPVDVVLCQMGEASLSSARAGLDQFDRTAQTEQNAHIAECTSVIDQVEISDAIVAGDLDIAPEADWHHVAAGNYRRQQKYSTDRLKDMNTLAIMVKSVEQGGCGISKSTAYEMFGFSFEDEQELKLAEAQFIAAQGPLPVDPNLPPAPVNSEGTATPPPPLDDKPAPAPAAPQALDTTALFNASAKWRAAIERSRERMVAA